MQGRFVYVFSQTDKDKLLSRGLQLLKSDEAQNIYVFISDGNMTFADDVSFVFSDTLTF